MSALIDFDGEGPVMTPGQLTSQISSLCCALMIVFFSIRSPIKTPPVIAMVVMLLLLLQLFYYETHRRYNEPFYG